MSGDAHVHFWESFRGAIPRGYLTHKHRLLAYPRGR
jgi:hypothetical protein